MNTAEAPDLNLNLQPRSTEASWQVEVHLFAAAAETAATRRLTVMVPPATNLLELQSRVVRQCPALEPLVMSSRWAVDCQFVEPGYVIDRNLEIALIPPVSGG